MSHANMAANKHREKKRSIQKENMQRHLVAETTPVAMAVYLTDFAGVLKSTLQRKMLRIILQEMELCMKKKAKVCFCMWQKKHQADNQHL